MSAENKHDTLIRDKIIHVLSIFSRISPSMLQVGIGPALPRALWNPIIEELIEEGIVQQETKVCNTPSGRSQNYKILSLTPKGMELAGTISDCRAA